MARSEAENKDVKVDSTSLKGFKSNSDIENFYRYVHENGLRMEAKKMLEYAYKKTAPKPKRGRKAKTLQ